MTIEINKAHDVDHGLLINDPNSGNNVEGPFITGGPNSPVGLNLPEKTMYVQNTASGIIVWEKYSNGVNDWKIYPANKIGFDPANVDITATDVQAAIESQANRHYGKDYQDEETIFNDSTTGGAFKIFQIFNFNVSDDSGSNKYRVQSNFFWGHNSASNDIRVQLLVDGTLIYEMRKEPKDPGSDQRIDGLIAGAIGNLSQGTHSVTLQYRPATASRVSRMYRAYSEIWRVE